MNTPKYTTDQRLEFIEKLLFITTPFRKLPPELQERAAELFPPTEQNRVVTPRVDIVLSLFKKIINMTKAQRKDARFPRVLNPHLTEEEVKSGQCGPLIKAAPLSLLINRCKQRKDFVMKVGDISQLNNIMNAIKKSGLVVTTLHDAGIQEGSEVKIVLTREAAIERNVPGYVDRSKKPVVEDKPAGPYAAFDAIVAARGEEPEDESEDDDLVLAELAAKRDSSESREEIQEALSKAEATPAPKIAVWDDSGEGPEDSAEEETFEESEAASAISFDRGAWESDVVEEETPTKDILAEPETETDEHGDAGEWNDYEEEGDQPEHHPFVDFDLAGEQAPKKVGVFVRKP